MSGSFTKRCFESVAALQRLNPQVLRALLAIFPEFCKAHGIELAPEETWENQAYTRICAALMGNAVPVELDEIMFLSSGLGHGSNWDAVEQQAREDKRSIPCAPKLSYTDLAILLSIEEWPKHRLFLERANARARVQGKSSFMYYAPSRDWRTVYRTPTETRLAMAREELIRHFVDCGLIQNTTHGRATEIVPYDYENEIWFLTRYPGRIHRQTGYDNGGNSVSYAFNPQMYDVIVYNKLYGDLRMNTHCKREHVKYRTVFGRLLFGDDAMNVFNLKAPVVTLDPLLDERSADLFNSKDVPGLSRIEPLEIFYEIWGLPPRQFMEKNKDGSSVLTGAPYGTRVLPEHAHIALRLVVAYKLDNGRKGKLTLHQFGNRVNYERDGDSIVLEDWLRRRGFVKSFVEVADAASKAA